MSTKLIVEVTDSKNPEGVSELLQKALDYIGQGAMSGHITLPTQSIYWSLTTKEKSNVV
jgi:hypothetical protein